MFHLSSLIIILIFGIMLSNYRVFFKGNLIHLLNEEKVNSVLNDMRVVTAETAFVVRTFFFIIFGWSVFLGSLLNFKVIMMGLLVLAIIYVVRGVLARNAQLVSRAREIIERMGARVVTPQEARNKLKLRGADT